MYDQNSIPIWNQYEIYIKKDVIKGPSYTLESLLQKHYESQMVKRIPPGSFMGAKL